MSKRVHFLGIGGSGASAAAAIAEAQGFEVTGCDLEPNNEFTTVFKPEQLLKGHSPEHIFCHSERLVRSSTLREEPSGLRLEENLPGSEDCHGRLRRPRNDNKKDQSNNYIDILAVTPAIFSLDPDNPELLEAKKKGISIMTWQQFIGEYLVKDKFVIAVCGTHGKTTTTAMIAKLLEDAGLDPTVELGAIVPWWKTNYRVGKEKLVLSDSESFDPELKTEGHSETRVEGYFVIEADEFNDNFLHLKPDITIVTNIEMDHPEYFKDFEAVKVSFRKFLSQTKGKIIANFSDPGVKQTLSVHPKGVNTIIDYSKKPISFPLQIPGRFNIMNASAAFQVGFLLGIDQQVIKQSLSSYSGVGRRFEYIGEYNPSASSGQAGAKVYSDFGHHPTEIKVTMEAVREKFPHQRLLLVYQPHMFSRTKALFDDFVKVFQNVPADKTFIIDIYPSREVDTGLTSSKELVEAINKPSVFYIGQTSEVLSKLKPQIQAGDIVFFMSAGDTDKLAKQLVNNT